MIDEEKIERVDTEDEIPVISTEDSRDGEVSDKDAEDKASGDEDVDYALVIEEDLKELRAAFPELRDIESITELEKPIRYAALRDLGLSAREAYLATTERRVKRDNRAHLSSAVPKGAGSPQGGMTRGELESARELFPGLADSEIQNLYKRVRA